MAKKSFDEIISNLTLEEKISYVQKYKKQLSILVEEKESKFLVLSVDKLKEYNQQIKKLLLAISKIEKSYDNNDEDSVFLGCGEVNGNTLPIFIKKNESNFMIFKSGVKEIKDYYLFLHLKQITDNTKHTILFDYKQTNEFDMEYIDIAKSNKIENFFYLSSNKPYLSTPINILYDMSNYQIMNMFLSFVKVNDEDKEIMKNIIYFILLSFEFLEKSNSYSSKEYKDLVYKYELIKSKILLKEKFDGLGEEFDFIKIKDKFNQNVLNNILSFKEYESITKYSRTFITIKDIFNYLDKDSLEKLFNVIKKQDSSDNLDLEQLKVEIENLFESIKDINTYYIDFLHSVFNNVVNSNFGELFFISRINPLSEDNNFVVFQTDNNNSTQNDMFIYLVIFFALGFLEKKDNINILLNNILSDEILELVFYYMEKKENVLNFNYIFDTFSFKDENKFNVIKL